MTDQLCAIESMRHSVFCAEPSGVPSSKYARRYHSPSHAPSAPSLSLAACALYVLACWASPRDSATPRTDRAARRETSRATRSRRGPVRPLRPCRRSNRRYPSAATHGRPSASSARLRACSARKSRAPHSGARAFRTRCASSGPGARCEMSGAVCVEDAPVARHARVLQRRIHQPEAIVLDARAHALPTRLVPPVLHVAFGKLPAGGTNDVIARDSRHRSAETPARPAAGPGIRTPLQTGRTPSARGSRQPNVWYTSHRFVRIFSAASGVSTSMHASRSFHRSMTAVKAASTAPGARYARNKRTRGSSSSFPSPSKNVTSIDSPGATLDRDLHRATGIERGARRARADGRTPWRADPTRCRCGR